ncbi:hypothetical protein [uncultured Shimia sp.]|uniref:hypothetical protein n=1 Tax=uncultured Shimia sp. TaxID=573152 RepID=UPI0025D1D3EA|nr:hypothetical protein [uncultured Shimia sp.]
MTPKQLRFFVADPFVGTCLDLVAGYALNKNVRKLASLWAERLLLTSAPFEAVSVLVASDELSELEVLECCGKAFMEVGLLMPASEDTALELKALAEASKFLRGTTNRYEFLENFKETHLLPDVLFGLSDLFWLEDGLCYSQENVTVTAIDQRTRKAVDELINHLTPHLELLANWMVRLDIKCPPQEE